MIVDEIGAVHGRQNRIVGETFFTTETSEEDRGREIPQMKSKFYTAFAVLVVVSGLFFAMPASAHHSLDSEFNHNKTTTITGVLSSVEWVNPHIYIYMDAKILITGR